MNKIIWYIFIPTLIFAGLLLTAGFLVETHVFFWFQNFEMLYLYSTLILTFIGFRLWRMGVQFRSIKELRVLFGLLFVVFATDVSNTTLYLLSGQGLLWENRQISPAGAAFMGSLILLTFAFIGLRTQIRLARVKSQ